jgi:hypothetical protein
MWYFSVNLGYKDGDLPQYNYQFFIKCMCVSVAFVLYMKTLYLAVPAEIPFWTRVLSSCLQILNVFTVMDNDYMLLALLYSTADPRLYKLEALGGPSLV